MTCIVGLVDGKTVVIGGDSAAVGDDHLIQVRRESKVFRNGPALIGYCSSFRLGQLLRFGLSVPSSAANEDDPTAWMVKTMVPLIRTSLKEGGHAEVQDNVEAAGGSFLMAIGGRLYQMEEDFHVGEPYDGYDAIGAGAHFALGSLHATRDLGLDAEKRVALALEAATHFCTGVRAPFHIMRTESITRAEKPK